MRGPTFFLYLQGKIREDHVSKGRPLEKANQNLQLYRLKRKRLEYLRRKWQRLSPMLLPRAENEGKDKLRKAACTQTVRAGIHSRGVLLSAFTASWAFRPRLSGKRMLDMIWVNGIFQRCHGIFVLKRGAGHRKCR